MGFSRLTIFLLRPGLKAPADAIDSDKPTTELVATPSSGITGSLFYVPSVVAPPSWVAEVDSILTGSLQGVNSASASGVFVIKTSKRWFAVSFGYGRSLLDPAWIERQFGLKVGLNMVNPSQLRSMNTKTFDDLVVSKSTQSSKSSDLPAFGVDVYRDILRGVAGIPRDSNFASRLAGSDAVVIAKKAKAKDLPDICDRLLTEYQGQAYKANFSWIDQLSLVEDSVLELQLNDALVAALRVSDTSSTYMAAPENIDWEDVESFTLNGTRAIEYEDLDLDLYLANQKPGARAQLSLEILKQRAVHVKYSRSQQTDKLWSVYQTLISEQTLGLQFYVLIEGRWFVVDKTLSDKVNTFFSSLPQTTKLPAANPNETEPDFNLRVAREHPSEYLHLDTKIVRPGGAASGIEFCDLLCSDGTIVHVKRKSRSATLSHLFAQGSVSATSLVTDPEFRTGVRAAITANAKPAELHKWLSLIPEAADTVDATKFRVSYVVLTKPLTAGRQDWMPFFSKLNLLQHATQLLSMRYKVHVSRLDN